MLLLVAVCSAVQVRAQVVPGQGAGIGSVAADRARLDELSADRVTATRVVDTMPFVRPIWPTLGVVWNSALPSTGNDGALWAGRGPSANLSGGVAAFAHHAGIFLDARFEPELVYSRNDAFQILPGREAGRSPFSSPWHLGAASADLPLRFGDQSLRVIGPGQSALTLGAGPVALGFATSNEWWGPGIRNTLVLSNNAAGIPRLFVGTSHPVRTRIGLIDAHLFAGTLTESPFFDGDSSNDHRAISGALVTLRPNADPHLTLGLSRVVISPASSAGGAFDRPLQVLTHWEPTRTPTDTLANGATRQTADQISSAFMRWVFVPSHLEVYSELAYMELPRSLRDYLVAPQSTEAYVLGLQWAPTTSGGRTFRFQVELSNLEQTDVWPERPPMDFYTGRAAVQGFTQRGQVLGAAAGPGSSSQFVAVDNVATSWQGGVLAGRTRTENDALYRQTVPRDNQHDVLYFGGIRGAKRTVLFDLTGEIVATRRLNYLFENDFYLGEPVAALDVSNLLIRFRLERR